jgi:apolipoprotein N-acyltransferase
MFNHFSFFTQINKQKTNFEYTKNVSLEKKNTHNNNKMNKNIERIFGEIVPFSGFLFWLGKRTNQRGITAHTKEEDGRGHAPTLLIAYYRWDKTAASLSFS